MQLRNHTAHGRGILAGAESPTHALKAVRKALDLAGRVWKLVDEQQPLWDRFADTQVIYPKSNRTPIAGVGARKSWPWPGVVHVLTAWNPAGIWSPHDRNAEANHHLEETLRRHGAEIVPVVGRSIDGKWREDSFLVFGLKRQQAADLGTAFGQSAVFEIDSDTLLVIRSDDGNVMRIKPRVRSMRIDASE